MRWRWIFAGVPVLLGAIISLFLNSTNQAPLYRFTIDLGTICFVFIGTAPLRFHDNNLCLPSEPRKSPSGSYTKE